MTELLDKAIREARKLSERDQDALGAILLEEIADEARWARKFADTRRTLEQIADESLAALDSGETSPMEFPPPK